MHTGGIISYEIARTSENSSNRLRIVHLLLSSINHPVQQTENNLHAHQGNTKLHFKESDNDLKRHVSKRKWWLLNGCMCISYMCLLLLLL